MKFVHIAGTPWSGKTTIILNVRHELGVLYSRETLTFVPESGILFVGTGLEKQKYFRKVGTDTVSRTFKMWEAFLQDSVLGKFPDETTLIMDAVNPILKSNLLKDHEKVVKFCLTSREQFSQRNITKPVEYYLKRQALSLKYHQKSPVALTVWPSSLPASERIDDVMETLGIRRTKETVVDFRYYLSNS